MKSLLLMVSALSMLFGIPADHTDQILSLQQIARKADDLTSEVLSEVYFGDQLARALNTYMEDNRLEGEDWAISVAIPEIGEIYSYSDEPFQTAASTIKLFLCGAVMENMDALTENYSKTTIDSLVRAALTVSDNEASTELVVLLGNGDMAAGKEIVNEYCEEHGYDHTYLGIIFSGFDDTGTYNATSVQDTSQFLSDLLAGKLEGGETILNYMKQSERLEKIPAVLNDSITTANKTGELDFTQNDCAIVYDPKLTYILSVMIDETTWDHGVNVIQEISEIVNKVLNGKKLDFELGDNTTRFSVAPDESEEEIAAAEEGSLDYELFSGESEEDWSQEDAYIGYDEDYYTSEDEYYE